MRDLARIVLTGLAAAVATISVGYLNFFNTSRELDIRMVELSLSILSGERPISGSGSEAKIADQYYQSRMFALRALSKYSSVHIAPEDMEDWARAGLISFGTLPAAVEVPMSDMWHNLSNCDNAGFAGTAVGKLICGNWVEMRLPGPVSAEGEPPN